MADLRTEMLKTIQVWNKENTMEQPKMSFGEKMFEWVKKTPHATVTKARADFPDYKDSILSTALKTMVDRGILGRKEVLDANYKGFGRKSYFEYYAISPTYSTVKKGYWKKKTKVEIVKRPPETREELPVKASTFSADKLVESLNLYQAKEVYHLLRGVFESRL